MEKSELQWQTKLAFERHARCRTLWNSLNHLITAIKENNLNATESSTQKLNEALKCAEFSVERGPTGNQKEINKRDVYTIEELQRVLRMR